MAWWNSLKDLTGDIKRPVVGAGHVIGEVAHNPWVQGLTAAGLAATGVGAPAAAAIMAAERGGGNLLRPGGNIGQGLAGAAQGAAMGYGASKLGDLARSFAPSSSLGTNTIPGVQMTSSAPDVSYIQGPGDAALRIGGQVAQQQPTSMMSHLGDLFSGAVSGIKNNAVPIAMLGQGIMNARAQNRQSDLDEQKFKFDQQQYQDSLARRQQQMAALAPLLPYFTGQARPVAPNPYPPPAPSTNTSFGLG